MKNSEIPEEMEREFEILQGMGISPNEMEYLAGIKISRRMAAKNA
jgi:hypothetical protein